MWGLLGVVMLTQTGTLGDTQPMLAWDTLPCCLPLLKPQPGTPHPPSPAAVGSSPCWAFPRPCESQGNGRAWLGFHCPQPCLTQVVDGEVQLPDVDVHGALGDLDHLLITCGTARSVGLSASNPRARAALGWMGL